MEHESWQPPQWWYREKKPSNDGAYFENMCRVIFQAGLNWQVVDKKWTTTKEAFQDFNIRRVAAFTDQDVVCLLKDSGIIRNKGKIKAIIRNAQTFLAIEKKYGSFQKYLDNNDKSDNYAQVIKTLVNNFKWLGPASASTFLYTVGENINVWEHK
ncbi:MAG TPA: DNA-3-methyladenine glycosylase I [Candidatus Acidoferrales bacterium]|nr:DNA-3-methyladenine glycosylase I [Candidatus Acidoferrales bacterium]